MIAPLEERLDLTSDQLRAIFARPVAYHKLLAIAGGSVGAGVFLSQLVYWTDKSNDPDGWIYKTLDDWWVETALGRYELKTIRNALTSRDLIEEKLSGVPARLHYKINWETMKVSLAKAIVTHRDGMSKRGAPTNQFVALPHTGDATGKDEASPHPTYRAESTTESTTTTRATSELFANGHSRGEPVVVVSSLASEGDEPRDIVDKLTEELGLSIRQGREVEALLASRGAGYVIEKAEIVRNKKGIKNMAGAFMKALSEDWKAPKSSNEQKVSKTAAEHEHQEPSLSFEDRSVRLAKMKSDLASAGS
jgi:hypothetical protein